MKRIIEAISEKIFENWDKKRQNQWLKDHPNSKFKNLDEIKNLREDINTRTSIRMSDYVDNWGQGNREREIEDRELQSLDEKLRRLERKPLHKVKLTNPKVVSPLNKYKIPQEGEPSFSKSLEPFTGFSKKTGIRNINDLKSYAESLSRDYGNYEARQEFKKLADSLLNKYKGTVVKSGELNPDEKKLIQQLAIYKKEKEFYIENERRKNSPEYKKYLEMRDNWERENRKLKPLITEWYNAKGQEARATSPEEKSRLAIKRAKLGKELHNKRLEIDKLIKETDNFRIENESNMPDMFPVSEPIFGKQTIDSDKLGLKFK